MNLCRSCKKLRKSNAVGIYERTFRDVKRKDILYCEGFFMTVVEEATECSEHELQESIDLKTMKEMAFILEKKNIIGFDEPVFEFQKPKKIE